MAEGADQSITAAALLDEEGRVRAQGTGLQAADLLGCWQLEQVWPKGKRQAAQFSGVLLRGLAAQLEIREQGGDLQLRNSVRLGGVELFFEGPGTLTGRRPLLEFQFLRMGLRVAGRQWWGRALPAPSPQRMPFFALICRDSSGWLAARGRGGGLAQWRLSRQDGRS
ncbi:hypothetical protein [Synechococcus sp. W4D4]|uniref:hypothetical protein n=1 Tax=Synechococcus sp. W4D4 TaxID=3392294 RepID=UPI0039E7D7EF